jgi:hypothetical protein
MSDNIDTPPPSGIYPDKDKLQDAGSLGLGIGLAWLIAVVGTPLSIGIASALTPIFNKGVVAFGLLPYLLIIVLAIFHYRKGKTRTGLGLMLGLLSIVAVVLLLVAACFGMLSGV